VKINPPFLLAILLVYTNVAYAQSWRELNPPPNIFTDAIFSVAADNAGNVYAAGKLKNSGGKFMVANWNGQWNELGGSANSLNANNVIYSVATDNTGNVYAAGAFAGASGYIYVAKWNGTAWSQVGTGSAALNANGTIYCMTIDNANNIYVAGAFPGTNGKPYVAKWDGDTWSSLGGTTLNANGLIYSLATDNSGNVYAAGHFTNTGNKYYVAKWDGNNWSELGVATPLNANDYINCIKTDNAGNIYAAGAFRNAANEYYVAKYNGTSWAEMGTGADAIHANGPINTLTVNNPNNVFAAGYGTNSNGGTNVMKWNGISWSQIFEVGYATNNSIRSIILDNAGNLFAGGEFKNGGGHCYVAKWDGASMQEYGRQGEFLPVSNRIMVVMPDVNGYVYAIGDFWSGPGNYDLAKWNGITWTRMKNPNNPNLALVSTVTTDQLGNIYAAGGFANNGEPYVAKWNGTDWVEVANPATPLNALSIQQLTADSNNNIYAAGVFVENSTPYNVAKWDGTSWTKFGTAGVGSFTSIVPAPGGNVYVSGYFTDNNGKFYVAKAGPTIGWIELGTGANALNASSFISALSIDHSGNLYAIGMLDNVAADSYVAKWDGTTWNHLGTPPDHPTHFGGLTADSTGNVYVGGDFDIPSYHHSVIKWNGANWNDIASGYPTIFNSNFFSLANDKRGNVYAGGTFSNEANNQYVAAYGNSVLVLRQPLLSNVANQYCGGAGNQTIKILNLPDTTIVLARVRLDATLLNISADTTFVFNPSTLSAGTHRLKISFSHGPDSLFMIKDFIIAAASTPDVNISASTTTVIDLNPVTVTASNASGGGTSPLYTFAKDRSFTNILQAESSGNTVNIDPVTLTVGDNWIYARMRTSNTCYTAQTNTDSIKIIRTVATGIRDIDYPNQEIYVYPVPFTTSFTIKGLQSSKSYTVTLISPGGHSVFRNTIRNNTGINVSQTLPPGMYSLVVYDNSKKRFIGTLRLIKN